MLQPFSPRRAARLLCLAVAAACAGGAATAAAPSTLNGAAPLVLAHRGASGYLPEHTLGGYELAIRMGADYIEPDLQLTSDGELVAMHDSTLTRTTNVASLFAKRNGNYRVSDFTLAEIKTLTVKPVGTASISYPGFMPSAADPYRIPTFQEVITLARQQSLIAGHEIGIYPEAKQADPAMETKILDTLVANGYQSGDKVYIQSFSADTIKSINDKQTALGYDFKLVVLNSSANALVVLGLDYLRTFADGLGVSIGSAGMGEGFIDLVHAAQMTVHGYTFSKQGQLGRDEYLKFYGWGLDGVFSNYTDQAVAARTEFMAAIPEPSTYALFGLGLACVVFVARRRATRD